MVAEGWIKKNPLPVDLKEGNICDWIYFTYEKLETHEMVSYKNIFIFIF